MGDSNMSLDRISELRRAMMDDGVRSGIPFLTEDLLSLLERGRSEGSSFFRVTLPLLGKALDQGLIAGHFMCPSNFSLRKGSRLPKLFSKVFQRIFEDSGQLRSEPDILAIHHLRQFLLLDSKLFYEPSNKEKVDAVDSFENRMRDLRKVKLPIQSSILKDAQRLLKFVLKGLDLSDILPGHGPGSVSEKLSRFERWDFPHWPSKAEKVYPHVIYGSPSISYLKSRGKRIPRVGSQPTRICLVPKDFKGPRLISAEGYINQYLQQGQMKKMMQYISNHWLLSRSIKLEDQTFNRTMGQYSFHADSATLDLSNASDTVSVPLVWYLLSGVPTLRRQLFATRSEFALYEGRSIKIAAFAPMGSATCFPIETLVFWALTMASVRHNRPLLVQGPSRTGISSRPWRSKYMTWKEISTSVAVFGDDIVVPTDCLETLTSMLVSVGCFPNMSKTCWRTPFRESCGGEWFAGIPITITRNRRYQYVEKSKLIHYPVLLDLQRKFYAKGWEETAGVLHKWAKEIWPVYTRTFEPVPCYESGIQTKDFRHSQCSSIGHRRPEILFEGKSPSPRSYHNRAFESAFGFRGGEIRSLLRESADRFHNHDGDSPFVCAFGRTASFDALLKVRFNKDYQRFEFRVPVEVQPSRGWGTEGWPRLMARLLSDQVERVASRDRKVKLAWRYLPAYMGLSTLIEG